MVHTSPWLNSSRTKLDGQMQWHLTASGGLCLAHSIENIFLRVLSPIIDMHCVGVDPDHHNDLNVLEEYSAAHWYSQVFSYITSAWVISFEMDVPAQSTAVE